LKNAHAGDAEVQARLFVTYRREYENFTHLPNESIDAAMFQRFTMIVNNMRDKVVVLPYDDHDRAVKLLHFLDRTVWSGKVETILELENYETLAVNELFSKLKSSEVDRGVRAKIENPRTDHKHRSKDDKGKNKFERRPKRSFGHKKKERAMVAGASDIDSSSYYSSSSSSDEEENRHKGMAHSSASKKSNKDDSGSDSKEEVNNDLSFLTVKNARLNDLLDNCDDVLRKTNKEKREYRSLLGEAKEKVVELESLFDDARSQIRSLKSAPILK
jgi:hypothetical protein